MKSTSVTAGIKGTAVGTLHLASGSTITIEESDIVGGSLTFKSGTSESGEISVGAAIISECSFTLLNDTGKFSGIRWYDSRVSFTYTVGDTTLNMGKYYTVKHTETGLTIAVQCYDVLKILDEYQIYEDNIKYPCDISEIINTIASNRGITVSGVVSGIEVEDPGDDTLTERAVFSYLAQMMGKFVKSGDDDSVVFDWYDTSKTYNAGTTFSHDLQTEDYEVLGVSVSDYDNTTVANRGNTTDNYITISGNPFITASNAADVATTIFSAVNGLTFRPGTIQIASNPAIEAGDMLIVTTGQEENICFLATNVTYKTSTLKQSLTADAPEYASDLRINQTDYIKKQVKETVKNGVAESITEDIVDTETDLSQAIQDLALDSVVNGLSDSSSDFSQSLSSLGFGSGSNTLLFIPSRTDTTEYPKQWICPYVNITTGEWSSITISSITIERQIISVPSRDVIASYFETYGTTVFVGTDYSDKYNTNGLTRIFGSFYIDLKVSMTSEDVIEDIYYGDETVSEAPTISGILKCIAYWYYDTTYGPALKIITNDVNCGNILVRDLIKYPNLRFFPNMGITTNELPYLVKTASGWDWVEEITEAAIKVDWKDDAGTTYSNAITSANATASDGSGDSLRMYYSTGINLTYTFTVAENTMSNARFPTLHFYAHTEDLSGGIGCVFKPTYSEDDVIEAIFDNYIYNGATYEFTTETNVSSSTNWTKLEQAGGTWTYHLLADKEGLTVTLYCGTNYIRFKSTGTAFTMTAFYITDLYLYTYDDSVFDITYSGTYE